MTNRNHKTIIKAMFRASWDEQVANQIVDKLFAIQDGLDFKDVFTNKTQISCLRESLLNLASKNMNKQTLRMLNNITQYLDGQLTDLTTFNKLMTNDVRSWMQNFNTPEILNVLKTIWTSAQTLFAKPIQFGNMDFELEFTEWMVQTDNLIERLKLFDVPNHEIQKAEAARSIVLNLLNKLHDNVDEFIAELKEGNE